MTDFEELLRTLTNGRVDFILIGGLAARAHGSARSTQDVDVLYSRSESNLERLVEALAPLQPTLRGAPPGLPFRFDLPTVRAGLNFTLSTPLGALDLLGEVSGGGAYERMEPGARPIEIFGLECLCLDLDQLIATKRAAGRPRDLETIAELEALREEKEKV